MSASLPPLSACLSVCLPVCMAFTLPHFLFACLYVVCLFFQFILVESTDELYESNNMYIQFQPVCERPNQSPDCKAEQVLILLYLLYGL